MPVLDALRLDTPQDAIRLLRWTRAVAIDLETTGLDPRRHRVRLLQLATEQQTVVVDCFEHDIRSILPWMAGRLLVAHHAAFDLGFLWAAGLRDLPETICTYLMAQLCTAGQGEGAHGFPRLGLGACCLDLLGITLDKELQSSDWSKPLSDAQVAYARKDVEVLWPLFRALAARLEKLGLVTVSDVESRALPAFVWMARSGVPFDREAWQALAVQAEADQAATEARLDQMAPFKGPVDLFGDRLTWNWASPAQVETVLRGLGVPVPSTNDAYLAECPHPIAPVLRRHRELSRKTTTYGTDWLQHVAEDGRVYPGWRQIGAASGRTSCQAPNMQQVPREGTYRACVRATEGWSLVKADYSMLQLRIAAKWADEKEMLRIFQAGGDIHTETARRLLGKQDVTKADRQIAKSANFGLLFGMSAAGLRAYAKATFGVSFSEAEAERHRSGFFRAYPGLARWHREVRSSHCKETRGASGRRRALPVHAPDTWRLNSPVQADESDGLKLALALLWERRSRCPRARTVLAVHDEIVVEVPTSEAESARTWLVEAMEDGMRPWLGEVPVVVDAAIRSTWGG